MRGRRTQRGTCRLFLSFNSLTGAPQFSAVLDATRISDSKLVTLKRVSTTVHPHEVEITRFFSTEPQASSPQNHCVRLLEVLSLPEDESIVILVLPRLHPYDVPPFGTVGELIEAFRQIFEVTPYYQVASSLLR